MIQVGGHEATLRDFEIPARYGLRQTIADTLGIGGIFRALRTVPTTCSRSGARWRSSAPTPGCSTTRTRWRCSAGSSTAARRRGTSSASATRCSSRREDLAGLVGVPGRGGRRFSAAGLNHQAFLLRFERDGEDLYPRLDDARSTRDPELQRRVRVAALPTASATSRPSRASTPPSTCPGSWATTKEIERYRIPVDEYVRRSEENLVEYERVKGDARARRGRCRSRASNEYAATIVHSMETGEPRVIYGNVRNTGLICRARPTDCCVEVPCLVDAHRRPPRARSPDYPAAARGAEPDLRERRRAHRARRARRAARLRPPRGDARPERRGDADARRDRRPLRRADRWRTATRSRCAPRSRRRDAAVAGGGAA